MKYRSLCAAVFILCLANNSFAETLLIPINAGGNDAEERQDNSMYMDSSDLELSEDNGVQTIGLRFTGIQIPAGSLINNAYVQFKVDETSSGVATLTISGDANYPAAPFTTTPGNISSRSLTSSQVNWSPPAWPSVGARGSAQQTPDLSTVLQEIIDGNGWQHGQSIALVINGTGERVAESYEGQPSGAATLYIDFTPPDTSQNPAQPEPLKVAFIGDQGTGSGAQQVLSLIANEDTDLLLIQGDLGYDPGTAVAWEANLSNILGVNFPVLTVVGNHENFEWPIYKMFITDRINRVPALSGCSGDVGVKSFCQFQNLDIVQVSPGVTEVGGVSSNDAYPEFITDSFDGVPASQGNRWRICTWHKNQTNMQTGGKSNETGWDVYTACLNAGAMIATGHEHAYSRTHLMDNFETQSVVHSDSLMTLSPGNSFAFVSGLGGRGIRPQTRNGNWWASVYTSSQGATHGALFCEYGATQADCYFKAVDGTVVDSFTLKLPVTAPLDSDSDGVIDSEDSFPQDPAETLDTDADGIGNNADQDDDGDNVVDTQDAFPLDPAESVDTDSDGIGNNADEDDDGDNVVDTQDAFPLDPNESADSDGDGIGDNADSDNNQQGPDASLVSNIAQGITIDGQLSDWSSFTSFGLDPDDVSGDNNPLNWREAWLAHDTRHLLIAWRNEGPISPSWGQSVYIDTDSSSATGYVNGNAIGAEYVVQAQYLYRYTGNGSDWQWEFVAELVNASSSNNTELRINLDDISRPESFRLNFVGSNSAYSGTLDDYYPDGVYSPQSDNRFFEYNAERPDNSAPLATNQFLIVPLNEPVAFELSGSDEENDSLSYVINSAPTNGTLTGTPPDLTYTPNADFSGTDLLTYTVNDGVLNSNTATINFDIAEANDATFASNLAVDLTLNGELSDWASYRSFGTDSNDVNEAENPIDWQEIWAAHDETYFYFAFVEHGQNLTAAQEWGYNAFIDSDMDISSGYSAGTAIGADFMLQGGALYSYNGSGNNDWNWTAVSGVVRQNAGANTEISLARQWLDDPAMFNVLFIADNISIGGDTEDAFPDGVYDSTDPVRFYTYTTNGLASMGNVPTIAPANPVPTVPSRQAILTNAHPVPQASDTGLETQTNSGSSSGASSGSSSGSGSTTPLFYLLIFLALFLSGRYRTRKA